MTPAAARHSLLAACVCIGAATWAVHGLFHAPALYADDWGQGLEEILEGRAPWFDAARLRPLLFLPFVVQHRLLGLNYDAHYAVLGGVYAVMALLLFLIARRSASTLPHDVALLAALLFVVFPTNYAHTWLTMAHHYSGAAMGLVYAWALLVYASGGRTWHLGAAGACLLVSVGFYEGHLGLAALWPAVLLVMHRDRVTWRDGVLWFSPAASTGALVVFRVLAYESPYDYYSADLVTVDPATLLSRLILGYKITLAWGWTETLRHYVPALTSTSLALVAVSGLVGAAALLASGRLGRRWRPDEAPADEPPATGHRRPRARAAVAGAVIGLISIGAGYVPIVTAFMPNLSGFSSRLNLFASLGGAWFFACCLMVVARQVATPGRERRVLWAAAAPLLVLGGLSLASAQYRVKVAWNEQRMLWQSLFDAAPDFTDGTLVLLVFPGLTERDGYWSWWRMPLEASWDASAALRLLYANPTLSADIVYPDLVRFREPVLSPAGVQNWLTRHVTPWDRVVAFSFDPRGPGLQALNTLPARLIVGEEARLCSTCVLAGAAPVAPLRSLVSERHAMSGRTVPR